MARTGIEWCDETWNPVRGCSRVSEGCRHCYAEAMAGRIVRMGKGKPTPYDGLVRIVRQPSDSEVSSRYSGSFLEEQVTEFRWTGKVVLDVAKLAEPLRWRKPKRVFVNSMSDLFHESLTNEQIAAVFGVMAATPHITYQVLTKRARRMREWFQWVSTAEPPYSGLPSYADHVRERSVCCRCAWMIPGYEIERAGPIGLHPSDSVLEHQAGPWPLPNVQLGVSAENQDAADERIPDLLATPAAVRFLSCEPLLGPVNMHRALWRPCADGFSWPSMEPRGQEYEARRKIHQVIAGCESGPGARACDAKWLRWLRDQCREAGVAFFLKQAREANDGGGRAIIYAGPGSKRKPGGIIGAPYLDGVQYLEMPKT